MRGNLNEKRDGPLNRARGADRGDAPRCSECRCKIFDFLNK
jgi:hypothetical protein